ncbi:MAG: NAD(P)H-hydrate dehydratase [Deltaproteobacteria bacterium]|nr:NAD(P)H-hydrate dehydratase [Deltaproteobacteria bacterium]
MDRLTMREYGVPGLVLMERAGAAIAATLVKTFGRAARRGVLVVAGKGNNGGDGLVVARHLKAKRIPCEVVVLARADELTQDAGENLRAYCKRQGKVFEADGSLAPLKDRLKGKALLVDAILGTGLKEEVGGIYGEAIKVMNDSGLPIVAVDVPSGLDSDRGKPLGSTVTAALTVALGFPKVGEVIYPGLSYVGELVVADIGIDPKAVQSVRPQTEVVEAYEIHRLIPKREPDTHKGTYGHLLVWAGSRGKTGAAILACRAALRVGAGLVTLAAPRSLNDIFASSMVEVMTEPLRDDGGEEPEPLSDEDWRSLLAKKNALLFGPGIGVKDSARNVLRWLLRNLDVPWVIDADGLNILAAEVQRLRSAKSPPVLTPHPGEMARLIGASAAAVNHDRVAVSRSFAREHRCYLVLKGARTVVATPEGQVFINPTGNPGMASGGMGDVLAGIVAGLLAQGFRVVDALKLGVFLHGYVGDRVAKLRGEIGMIATDVLEALPQGLKELAEGNRQSPALRFARSPGRGHGESGKRRNGDKGKSGAARSEN